MTATNGRRWHVAITGALTLGLLTTAAHAQRQIEVAPNGRHLQTDDGKPFFYLGDTAWALFHRLTIEEADRYLRDRAEKGFNVVQAVALAELRGLDEPNAYGHLPLVNRDPATPNTAYFDHVDRVVARANELGLTVGLLPSWGRYWRDGDAQIFTPASALAYGRFLGKRYRDAKLIWILGGDSNVRSANERAIIDALARGLREGDGGRHLITFHPRGPGLSSVQVRDAKWLDFYMNQSSHAARDLDTGLYAEHDRALSPRRPVIDGEPRYEGIPVGFYNQGHDPRLRFDDDDTRQAAWWSILAGAAGHAYGNNNVWQMWAPGREPAIGANRPWFEAIEDPGARQMGILRRFMEANAFQTLEPRQDLILDGPTQGGAKVRAARAADGKRIIVYSPHGKPFTLDLREVAGAMHKQSWFDPRYGASYLFRTEQSQGIQSFVPPSSGEGEDWVLLIEQADGDTGAP
ncbi:glycoside hydrolase family 140 protein [Sphingopyxis sp. XHP0097]|uniref:Glycoside hydrolase family 140 protein n=1 Tax=Sphingopyxis jiangsuensis TaxID=2871171 RepID=A0ABS7MF43_9SPHN|nr:MULTISPECIES: glycoside hydrolase family 140 protein [Sphingopyxis]MBY4637643.1 glycoside hydrolase family 140 protein [Sphingopyxis jiangsuensis]